MHGRIGFSRRGAFLPDVVFFLVFAFLEVEVFEALALRCQFGGVFLVFARGLLGCDGAFFGQQRFAVGDGDAVIIGVDFRESSTRVTLTR